MNEVTLEHEQKGPRWTWLFMEELDRRKKVALVAVTLCTGMLIACFSIALALL